jgi:hypothetical protein
MKALKMTRKFLIELDDHIHKALKKIAQSKASRIKPYSEMVLKDHVEEHKKDNNDSNL